LKLQYTPERFPFGKVHICKGQIQGKDSANPSKMNVNLKLRFHLRAQFWEKITRPSSAAVIIAGGNQRAKQLDAMRTRLSSIL